MTAKPRGALNKVEWPTLLIGIACYAGILGATLWAEMLGHAVAVFVLTLALTLYSSFSHEVLHGHPFRRRAWNEALVFPAFGLFIPYGRFRDTHLAHHHDPMLTDPYDDPESHFVDPAVWNRWSRPRRALYTVNNTLLGRMTIGPVVGLLPFYVADIKAMRRGDRAVLKAYLMHGAGLLPVAFWLVHVAEMPVWLYAACVYGSFSILKIRTFLEHRAHDVARCRSVIIEGRGLLPFLFLNNNLHAVHHARPSMAWYRLPGFYRDHRPHFLRRNAGYFYRSYGEVFRRYMIKAKDPVAHTLWPFPDRRGGPQSFAVDLTDAMARQDIPCEAPPPSALMGAHTTARRLPNAQGSGRAGSAGDR